MVVSYLNADTGIANRFIRNEHNEFNKLSKNISKRLLSQAAYDLEECLSYFKHVDYNDNSTLILSWSKLVDNTDQQKIKTIKNSLERLRKLNKATKRLWMTGVRSVNLMLSYQLTERTGYCFECCHEDDTTGNKIEIQPKQLRFYFKLISIQYCRHRRRMDLYSKKLIKITFLALVTTISISKTIYSWF